MHGSWKWPYVLQEFMLAALNQWQSEELICIDQDSERHMILCLLASHGYLASLNRYSHGCSKSARISVNSASGAACVGATHLWCCTQIFLPFSFRGSCTSSPLPRHQFICCFWFPLLDCFPFFNTIFVAQPRHAFTCARGDGKLESRSPW